MSDPIGCIIVYFSGQLDIETLPDRHCERCSYYQNCPLIDYIFAQRNGEVSKFANPAVRPITDDEIKNEGGVN